MPKEFGRNPAKDYFANPEPYLRNNPYIALRAGMVRRMLPPLAGKAVLDLGCGDGRISMPLAEEARELWLVDASAAMLENARRHTPPEHAGKIRCVCTDLTDFEPPHGFDVVLCIGVLAHVADPLATVRLVARSLLPGGCAIVQLTDEATVLGRVTYRLGALQRRRRNPELSMLNHMTLQDVRGNLTQAGLKFSGFCRYLLIPGIRALPPNMTQAIFSLTAARPLARFGGEVLALFSA
jgi:SAM-dependent methyltransferase